jgi:tetratricopeptide (TPR) repeat protein
MFLLKVPNAPNRHDVETMVEGLEKSHSSENEDPDSELARRYFESGAKKYQAHDYEGAITDFERARMVKPTAAFDFNIGRSHDRLGHTAEALAAYRRYVESKPEPVDAAEVRARITILEERLPKETAAKPAAVAPAATAPPAPPPRDSGRKKTIAGIAVGVVGVAAIAGGIACGVLAQQNGDALTKLDQMLGTFSSAKETAGKSEQIAEGVLLGVGGAAVVTGVVLIALGRRAAAHHVAVAPTFGPGQAGAVAAGSF